MHRSSAKPARPAKPLSLSAIAVLDAIARHIRHGFDIMDATGLPSGATSVTSANRKAQTAHSQSRSLTFTLIILVNAGSDTQRRVAPTTWPPGHFLMHAGPSRAPGEYESSPRTQLG